MVSQSLIVTDEQVDMLDVFLEKLRKKLTIYYKHYMFVFSGMNSSLILHVCDGICDENDIVPEIVTDIVFDIIPIQFIGKREAKLIKVRSIQLRWPYYYVSKERSLELTKECLPKKLVELIKEMIVDLLVEE